MTIISSILLFIIAIPTLYLLIQMIASFFYPRFTQVPKDYSRAKFNILIPAHDESSVIAATISHLKKMDYPLDLYTIHVIADYCSDETAQIARDAGAVVHERNSGPRGGKGSAISWGLSEILQDQKPCDAVVVFDADTIVDSQFLNYMNERLLLGADVIQGQHIISNPNHGLFPALTWAMFIIDNRFQNYGKSMLGWSAKNMGDSICFRANILRDLGWGKGLTEDHQLRQMLLLNGFCIVYEPRAKAYGEAPATWQQAQAQRARWLSGTYMTNKVSGWILLKEWLRTGKSALLDGVIQAYFPSYSTLTLISVLLLAGYLIINFIHDPIIETWMIMGWMILSLFFFLYPFIGLALERAPLQAYIAILSGPYFILWRTWLAIKYRFIKKPVNWIRTEHGKTK